MASKEPEKAGQHSRIKVKILLGIFAFLGLVLITLRIYVPTWIKVYVNRTLNRLPDYRGEVGDIDLALIRGAYVIKNVRVVKMSGKIPVPLLSIPSVDLSVEWRALIHGKIVGEIYLEQPSLNFVNGPSLARSQYFESSRTLKIQFS